jgi:molybdopterin molybdotransferase
MAQPSSLADARAAAIALGAAAPTGVETLGLADAAGRVAAEDVAVRLALPLFDASAMDGWAVRSADLAGASPGAPVVLARAAEARAGHPPSAAVAPGTAAPISTGARLPAGADAVVRAEDAEASGGGVALRGAVRPGADVRRAGEDVRIGDVAVRAGDVLHAGRLALLAGTGVATVACRARPTVTVLITGDEVAGDGTLGDGEVHDVNGVAVPALLRAAGATVLETLRVGDDRDATIRALAATRGDVVVACGGVSVGPHDHVRPALAALGAEERIGSVALQPGKPAWLGALPGPRHPRPVAALPGNPGAALVCAALLVLPLLRAAEGRPPAPAVRARLAAPTRGDARRVRALRATVRSGRDGVLEATVLEGQQPHRLGSLAAAQALVLVPPRDGPLPTGATVEVVGLPGAADPG